MQLLLKKLTWHQEQFPHVLTLKPMRQQVPRWIWAG